MIGVLDPFAGLAGDMFLAALLDAGAPLGEVRASIAAPGLPGWELHVEQIVDHGLSATRVHVGGTNDPERRARELVDLVSRAMPAPVAAAARAAMGALARAEARLHGVDEESVHLHELGGHDTVVDIVGVCAALHHLGVDALHVAPLPIGRGEVTTRHGVLPVPAPATAALLDGCVTVGSDLPGETVTPTAAALIATLGVRWDPPPAFRQERVGYGAGSRRLSDRPNVAVVRLGTPTMSFAGERVVELATTVDDVPGEILGHVIGRALAAGALDAWVVPAVMKKSRPGHVLHVLGRPGDANRLRDLMLTETGSLGIRSYPVERHVAARRVITVEVDGRPVRVKIGPHSAKPEHDDVASVADALDLPLREVARRAIEEAGRT